MITLAVGMPRAGSGWHYNLVHDLVRTSSGAADARAVRARYHLEDVLTEVNCNIRYLSLRRLLRVMLPAGLRENFTIKLHAGPTIWGSALIRLHLLRPTYVYRDPRDALISAFEYGERARANDQINAFSPLDSLEKAALFIKAYVDDWERWLQVPGVHSLRYEDLKQNYDAEAERLANFLEVDPAGPEAGAVIEKYRPEHARADTQGLHFEKGISGRYREILSAGQQQYCLDLFGSTLEKMGYASE